MKRMICTRVSIGLWLAVAACQRPPEVSPAEPSPARDTVLIFSRTAGYRHASIPVGRATLTELVHELGWRVQTSEAPEAFLELYRVRCVVFLSTTGDVLGPA